MREERIETTAARDRQTAGLALAAFQ